ncbi:MAG: zinc-binding dehydrogenase [Candidatus Hydrogenedens sp.]|nr:zinc-binding dehydrogenase [Candidatus Hydrogenedens sp.]
MRAVVCHSYGPPENLSIDTVDDPQPGKGDVLIDVYAAGLNFPDTLQIQGKYQFQPPFPFTPGSEIAGVVSHLGEGVTQLAVGDRVLAMAGIGGMAEKIVVPEAFALKIPADMDMPSAAGFLMICGTSFYALKQRGRLMPGETLLVTGASGGVGHAAVQLGKAMGARVIAAASTPEKCAVAKEAGADETICYGSESLKDRVKALTGGAGADVIYDPVGGELFDQCARCVGWNGRILVIGFACGEIPAFKTNLALLKGSSIVGVFWGDWIRREPEAHFANCQELFTLFEQGKIRPHISQTFPLEQVADAMNVFIERRAVGKIVLEMQQEQA